MADVCGHCGRARGTAEERAGLLPKVRDTGAILKLFGGLDSPPGADIVAAKLAGLNPRCWFRDAEACEFWHKCEAEDAKERLRD